VGLEPGGLVGGEFRGGLAEVADGFEGELAGDVVGVVVGRGLDLGGPAVGGGEDLGQRLAQVGVARGVVVEVNCSSRSWVSCSRPGRRGLA
jgi:hypothetical protein